MKPADRSIKVFLASPGDVVEERQRVVEVVRQIDQTVAKPLGWHIEIFGWELRRPGLGRPQDLINPDVDDCNVLIGILASQFGSTTGEYGSGFEEEFERIRQRKGAGEQVDAMVYLSEMVSPGADPRNLAFRKQLRQLGLYDSYSSLEDLVAKVTAHLAAVVADFVGSDESGSSESDLQGAPGAEEGASPAQDGDASPEALSALEQVAAVLASGQGGLEELVLLRAHLAVSAELSNRRTSSLMHVHDLMRVYGHRRHVTPSPAEALFIGRSMTGLGDVGAGWGLLEDRDIERLGRLLFDSSEAVRQGALQQLGTAGLDALAQVIAPRAEVSAAVVIAHLWEAQEDDFRARDLFIRLLVDSEIGDVEVFLAWQVDHEVSHQVSAFEALVMRLYRSDPESAWELQQHNPSWVPSESEQALIVAAKDIGKQALIDASLPAALRRLGTEAAARTGLLSSEDVLALLNDEDGDVRRIALKAAYDQAIAVKPDQVRTALNRGGKWAADNEATDLRVRYLAQADPERLMEAARWNELDFLGVSAIRGAMATGHQPAFERARRDLADLEPTREQARRHLLEDAEAPKREAVQAELQGYSDLYDQIWLEGLMRGMADHGTDAVDAELIRPFLEHDTVGVREAAIDVLLRLRNESDHAVLLEAVARSYQDRTDRLRRIVEVRPEPNWLLEQLEGRDALSNAEADLLAVLAERDLKPGDSKLDELMRVSDSNVRRAALRLAARGKLFKELEHLLNEYIAAPRYRYYDIINLLDRLVYGPQAVQVTVRRDLHLD